MLKTKWKQNVILKVLTIIVLGITFNNIIECMAIQAVAEQGKEFIINSQEDFEDLILQNYRDLDMQRNNIWENEAIVESEMGAHPTIILNADVYVPTDYPEVGFVLPLDVITLNIQGNGHTIKGALSKESYLFDTGIAHLSLVDVTILPTELDDEEEDHNSLLIFTDVEFTLEVMGNVLLDGYVTISTELTGTYEEVPRVYINVKEGSSLTIGKDEDAYTGVDIFSPLTLSIDGGTVNAPKDFNIINYDSAEKSSYINIKNNGSFNVGNTHIDTGTSVAGKVQFDIDSNSHFESYGVSNGISFLSTRYAEYQADDILINVRDNSSFIVSADVESDNSMGLYAPSGLQLHVDNSVAIVNGGGQGIVSNYTEIFNQDVYAFSGTPSFFFVNSQEHAIVNRNTNVDLSSNMQGKSHGVIDDGDSTPYYAVVGTPTLTSNSTNSDTITTETNGVILDISRLANWETTTPILNYTFNNGESIEVPASAIERNGSLATIDISQFFTEAGTYAFQAYQEVEWFDSYISNTVSFEVAKPSGSPNPEGTIDNDTDNNTQNNPGQILEDLDNNGDRTDEDIETSDLGINPYYISALFLASIILCNVLLRKQSDL